MTIKRFTGAMLIEVEGGNPNGDPDSNGDPRILLDGHGLISAVSIKRKYRNLLEDHTNPITKELMVKTSDVDPESLWIFESHFRGFDATDGEKAIDSVSQYAYDNGENGLLQRYWDARTFGVTGLEKKPSGTSKDAKVKGALAIKRSGGISIGDAISVNTVEPVTYTITKKAPLRPDLAKNKQNDIAPDGAKCIKHGLYFARVVCDVKSAHESLMRPEDVEVFKNLTPHIFNQSMSAARPAGSIRLVHFWVKQHDQSTCSFNEFEFWNNLKPIPKQPETPSDSISDYHIPMPHEAGWEDVADWANQ